jgi:beta-N-acetylhexosaminidase
LPEWLHRELGDGGLAGVVLFSHNLDTGGAPAGRVGSEAAVSRPLAADLRGIRPGLLIGIDEEGGNVTRLEAGTGSSCSRPSPT